MKNNQVIFHGVKEIELVGDFSCGYDLRTIRRYIASKKILGNWRFMKKS